MDDGEYKLRLIASEPDGGGAAHLGPGARLVYPLDALATVSPSTPVADGFHMPAEFEPHDGCLSDLARAYRHLAPGREAGAKGLRRRRHGATTSEPVTVLASARQWEHARSVLPPEYPVVEMTDR